MFGATVAKAAAKTPAERELKVCIVYYSLYGHVKKLADEIAGSMREESQSTSSKLPSFSAPRFSRRWVHHRSPRIL